MVFDKVVVWFVSANYDEEAFPDAARFDVAGMEVRVVLFEELVPRISAGLHHRILDGQRRVRRNDVEARAL